MKASTETARSAGPAEVRKLRCQVGDLAIVLNCPRNAGRIVRVVLLDQRRETTWIVQSVGTPLHVNRGDATWWDNFGAADDKNLVPLPKGDDDGLTRSAEKDKPAKKPLAKALQGAAL